MSKTVAENRATLYLFGDEYEVESSLGAAKIYADTFRGNIEKPYTGNMFEDMLQIMREVEGDEENAFGVAPQVLGIAWAMARAAGTMKESWLEFTERVEHSTLNFFDFAEIYGTVIQKLGAATFRLPERLRNAVASDQTEETEDEESNGGGGDVERGSEDS